MSSKKKKFAEKTRKFKKRFLKVKMINSFDERVKFYVKKKFLKKLILILT